MDNSEWEHRIDSDPGILSGKALIAGTRISVEFILGLLAQGLSVDEILKDYPTLTREDVLACIKYALELVEETKFYHLALEKHGASAAD